MSKIAASRTSNRAIRVAFVRARLDRGALIKAARFGVAVWTAASLGALEIEMINGLVRDLNETTRFSTLPLPPPDNGAGVLAACGWTTGFPMRTGFGAGAPLHDPWRFDAERLVASGETDCVLWISAFGAAPPEWPNAMTVIALCEPTTQFAKDPNVRIAIGRPGVDHDAVMHSSDAGTLVAVTASARSAAPSVAQALERIAARPRRGERSAMLTHIRNAHIVDPANGRDEIGDLWIRDDTIVAAPQGGAQADETVDANGLIAMAGGIDIHSHIAGANVNTARLMLPEQHRAHARRPATTPLSQVGWTTFETGRLYAEMGFTTVVEPAVAPHNALHAHLELADTPIIDKAILTLLGNDDFGLDLMRSGESASAIRDHVAWTLQDDARARDQGRQRWRRGGVQGQHPQLFV